MDGLATSPGRGASRTPDRALAKRDPWSGCNWRTLRRWDFQTFGAIARLGPDGREHFNFPQRFSPYPRVHMGTSARLTPELETLAMNILGPCIVSPTAQGTSHDARRLRELARLFARDILVDVAGTDWRISRACLIEWIGLHWSPR